MNLYGRLNQSGQLFSKFWSMRDARERKILAAASVVLVITIVYALLIAPALNGRKQLNDILPMLRQQVAQLQELSKKSAELSDKPAPTTAEISTENIKVALARHNLNSQSLLLTGSYVKVQLAAASFANTLSWLNEMQEAERLFVVEAKIEALTKPDEVNANFTLRQSRSE